MWLPYTIFRFVEPCFRLWHISSSCKCFNLDLSNYRIYWTILLIVQKRWIQVFPQKWLKVWKYMLISEMDKVYFERIDYFGSSFIVTIIKKYCCFWNKGKVKNIFKSLWIITYDWMILNLNQKAKRKEEKPKTPKTVSEKAIETTELVDLLGQV